MVLCQPLYISYSAFPMCEKDTISSLNIFANFNGQKFATKSLKSLADVLGAIFGKMKIVTDAFPGLLMV